MPTSVRLPPSIEKRLGALARKTGRSKASLLRDAVVEHLDDLEDAYLAMKVLDRVRAGSEGVSSLDDVSRRLGLGR